MSECFKLFDLIHRVTTKHDVITRITREVLHDFHADGVVSESAFHRPLSRVCTQLPPRSSHWPIDAAACNSQVYVELRTTPKNNAGAWRQVREKVALLAMVRCLVGSVDER